MPCSPLQITELKHREVVWADYSTNLYYHWFALALYEPIYNSWNVIMLNNSRFEVELPALEEMIDSFKREMLLSSVTCTDAHGVFATVKIRRSELLKSSLLANYLQLFLFPKGHDDRGIVLHQAPVCVGPGPSGKVCPADIVIMQKSKLPDGCIILVSDNKVTDDVKAVNETDMYALGAMVSSLSITRKQEPIILGLPIYH